ncbi:MAG: hypothetical protein ABFD76_03330 [Smithella sp.]
MNKTIIIFIAVLLLFTPSILKATDYIPCEAGQCDGWDISYQKINDYMQVKFENNTGKTAFNLVCKVILYDMDGKVMDVIIHKSNIPIRKQTGFNFKPPDRMLKMGVEIYYKEVL